MSVSVHGFGQGAKDFGAIDARWFEKNPDRRYRIRVPVNPREFGMLGGGEVPRGRHGWIAVRQVRPGIRLRVAVIASREAPAPEMIGEDNARAIFEYVAGPSERAIADLMAGVREGSGEDVAGTDEAAIESKETSEEFTR